MAKGILGVKLGMTQIFDAAGKLVPVTVVDCSDNVVLQQKTVENDGYVAVQVGCANKRESLANKPELGHVAKANTAPKRFIREFRFSEALGNELVSYSVGQEINVDIFNEGDVIDVTGTSKGKGFAGTIKRYNHARLRMSHGTSACHRIVGSMGAIKGNMKGKKMPGHMGHDKVTLQNLTIAKVDVERKLILVRGNVPGPRKGYVVIKTAVKAGK
ncbi:MAG: 50S ribosomal protein L3 [Acholeplasmatales bacterium]|nr:50S ribosomal protein L3 [Acholeplasmatales bacterium]